MPRPTTAERDRNDAAALDLISRSEVSNYTLTLPDGDLDPGAFRTLKNKMKAVGATQKGFVFTFSSSAADIVRMMKGELMHAYQEFTPVDGSPFPLTEELADLLVAQLPAYPAADINRKRFLVPAAGDGALIKAMIRRFGEWNGLSIDATVTDQKERRELLGLPGQDLDLSIDLIGFLDWCPESEFHKYDAILINPPGDDASPAAYFMRAAGFLKPDGVLISLLPPFIFDEALYMYSDLRLLLLTNGATRTTFATAGHEAFLVRMEGAGDAKAPYIPTPPQKGHARIVADLAAATSEDLVHLIDPVGELPAHKSPMAFQLERGDGPAPELQIPIMIALGDIVSDPDQPRKRIDTGELQELADAIAKHNVLQPITVRIIDTLPGLEGPTYQIVFGERRWRASSLAGKLQIPAYVRDLTDEEVMELQIVENRQRADIHPMDEALFFARMLKTPGRTHHDIAARIGVSEKYVRTRLKLTKLIGRWIELFQEGAIDFSTALQIAAAGDAAQAELIVANPSAIEKREPGAQIHIPNLKWFLDARAHDLTAAPFYTEDPDLNPTQGPCSRCAFNTATDSLFSAEEKPTCTFPPCYRKKMVASFKRSLINQSAEGYRFIIPQEWMSDDEKFWIDVAKESGVEILGPRTYERVYGSVSKKDKTVLQAVCVTGDKRGEIVPIRLVVTAPTPKKAGAGSPAAAPAAEVATEALNMTARVDRADELAGEKLWEDVRNLIRGPYDGERTMKGLRFEFDEPDLNATEIGALAVLLYTQSDVNYANEATAILAGKLGIDPEQTPWNRHQAVIEALPTKATPEMLSYIQRIFLLKKGFPSGSSHLKDPVRLAAYEVARQRMDSEITSLELEFEGKAAKRRSSLEARIAALDRDKKAGSATPTAQESK